MKTCAFISLGYWVMNTHIGVKLLDHRDDVCFLETAKLFYKEVIRHILLIQFNKQWLGLPRAMLGLVGVRGGDDRL